MKKFTLLFLFFSLAVSAQESFPYKRPLLILNKTVTVIRIPSSEKFGYYDFFETLKPRKEYKVGDGVSTPEKELLGRSFTVTAIDSVKLGGKYNYILKLDDATETIYYRYAPTIVGKLYPLEVKGGLDLPEGFYSDYVVESVYDYSAKVIEISLSQTYNGNEKHTTAIFTFFDKFKVNGIESVTLLLENNKTVEKITNEINGSPQSGEYRYQFGVTLNDSDFELLKANKLIGVKLKDNVHTFHPGTGVTLAGVLQYMKNLPPNKD